MRLTGRPHDDLNWEVEKTPAAFEFDLGLSDPYFPLEDELYFHAISRALSHFSQNIWPSHKAKAILYRGSADFSAYFSWSERQEENYALFKERLPLKDEDHLKRLFCAEAFVHYFQMLAHKLPDEMPISLILDAKDCGTRAQELHLLSPARFEHFDLEMAYSSNVGICFPDDAVCSDEILSEIDVLIERLGSFKPVYEPLLTEQWDGLDEIYVISKAITASCRRKLLGFQAAGGKVTEN